MKAIGAQLNFSEMIMLTEAKVEVAGGLGRPQPHSVDNIVAVSRDGVVVGHGQDGLVVHPVLLAALALDDAAEELDGQGVLRPRFLPRVSVAEPVVRLLNLEGGNTIK